MSGHDEKVTLLLIRHASAGKRNQWSGVDSDRPLDPPGQLQAERLAEIFGNNPIALIYSSQALRCQQTVAPLARKSNTKTLLHGALFEGNHRKLIDLIRYLAKETTGDKTLVLCSHGDVIPEALRELVTDGMKADTKLRCGKGSVWELHVESEQVVSGIYHPMATKNPS